MVELLLQKKDVDINAKDRYNNTPLYLAYQEKKWEVAKMLLTNNKREIDVTTQNTPGRSALSQAVRDPKCHAPVYLTHPSAKLNDPLTLNFFHCFVTSYFKFRGKIFSIRFSL